MARAKEYKLPKYLQLVKGIMWMDIEGENCSGVRLYATDKTYVGRGYHADGEWEDYVNSKGQKPLSARPIPKKKFRGKKRETVEAFGYVEDNYDKKDKIQDRSVFCTDDIPKENLKNILTAYQNGVLARYDPRKAKRAKDKAAGEPPKHKGDFRYEDGDIVFKGKNIAMYQKLTTLSGPKMLEFIDSCGLNAADNLKDLYQYEIKGYNKVRRPRVEILDAIRKKQKSFGPSMSPVRVNDLD